MSDNNTTVLNVGGNDFETRDAKLAAALMAMRVPPVGMEPVKVITVENRPGRNYQYFLAAQSECGTYQTAELVKAWRAGKSWIEENEKHPFAYVMAAFLNHKGLVDYMKRAVPQVVVKRGRSMAVIPLDTSAKMEGEIFGRFR